MGCPICENTFKVGDYIVKERDSDIYYHLDCGVKGGIHGRVYEIEGVEIKNMKGELVMNFVRVI